MLIHQIQMDRLSKKFANLAAIHGPELPLMASKLGPKLYSDVVKQPPVRVWQPVSAKLPVESRKRLIQRKLEEIRSKSTTLNPICLRCGDTDHHAASCRNAQLCFVCNRFGHRALICRTPTGTYPFTPSKLPARDASSEELLAPSTVHHQLPLVKNNSSANPIASASPDTTDQDVVAPRRGGGVPQMGLSH
ncbi:hypothetical protein FCM35_KLT22339 [Carex littledalei]|uniref:CCHC-type domain-containing protein n=1 Tax=Carex littledalei TaxID=544730 RepID=A0A833QKC1_9POAL|nr:hypothetical protein FCM35_KLT22339 [Carex littledalei]